MVLIGIITQDAAIGQRKNGRKVIQFTLAINDYCKPHGGIGKTYTTYVKCRYWQETQLAPWLTQGSLLEIIGHLFVQVYTDMQGEARACLNCSVETLRILQSRRRKEQEVQGSLFPADAAANGDLPF